MTRNRRGVTILELLVTMLILAITAGIALPKVQEVRRRGEAAAVVGAIEVVRHAAYSYNESTAQWPPSAAFGVQPAGLAPYLPEGFSFVQPRFSLAWMSLDVLEGGQVREVHTIGASMRDGSTCAYMHGLLGGSANGDVTAVCWGGGGQVQLKMDR